MMTFDSFMILAPVSFHQAIRPCSLSSLFRTEESLSLMQDVKLFYLQKPRILGGPASANSCVTAHSRVALQSSDEILDLFDACNG